MYKGVWIERIKTHISSGERWSKSPEKKGKTNEKTSRTNRVLDYVTADWVLPPFHRFGKPPEGAKRGNRAEE